MKQFFEKLYASPWGRLARRFVIVGASAVIAYLVSTGKVVLSPEGLVDSVFSLSGADALFAAKLFVGAGFLAAVDKLRREGTWNWLQPSVDKPAGEQGTPVV